MDRTAQSPTLRSGADDALNAPDALRIAKRLVVVVAVVLTGLMTHGTHAGTGDEPHYLAIAHSLAFDGDLDLSNNYGANEPLIADGTLEPGGHIRRGVGGVLRPVHDIGLPLLSVPLVKIAAPAVSWIAPRIPSSLMHRLHLNASVMYRHILSLGMIALACVLALLLYRGSIVLGARPRHAFWSTLIVVLSPPLLIFSILFFTEMLSAFLVCAVFYAVVFAGNGRSNVFWAGIGAATGFLVLVHIRNVALAGALGVLAVVMLWRERRYPTVGIYSATFAVSVIVRTALIHHMWGSWITTPIAQPGRFAGAASLAVAGHRLAAMLMDQEYGLLPYAPIFVLAGAGLVWLCREHRAVVVQACLVMAAYVLTLALPVTNAIGWTGGWSPPARFLTPIVPLIALGMATGLRRTSRFLVVPLVVLQIAIDGYFWQHPKYLWNNGTGVASVCAQGGVPVCGVLPSFDSEDPARGTHERE